MLVLSYLLEKKVPMIMYAQRKMSKFTKFFLDSDTGDYKACSCITHDKAPLNEIGYNDVLLVDPLETGNDIEMVIGMLVLAASSNNKHFNNWMKGNTRMFYFTMYTLREILVFNLFMNHSRESENVLCFRFRNVGGSPRYVFNKVAYQERVNQMHNGANGVTCDLIERVLRGGPARTVEDRDRMLSTLFFGYFDHDNGSTVKQNDNIEPVVGFISEIAKKSLTVYKAAFDTIVRNSNPAKASYYGVGFEDLVRCRLQMGGDFVTRGCDKNASGNSDRSFNLKQDAKVVF